MIPPFKALGHRTPAPDLDALAELARSLEEDEGCKTIVEVGSWTGGSALVLAEAAPEAKVYCVDCWAEGQGAPPVGGMADYSPLEAFQAFCHNMGDLLLERVFPLRGLSSVWAPVFPLWADLIFLDGDHSYKEVRRDIELWYPKVRPGGILCGHDYERQFPGLKQAVNELVPQVQCRGISIWWVRK